MQLKRYFEASRLVPETAGFPIQAPALPFAPGIPAKAVNVGLFFACLTSPTRSPLSTTLIMSIATRRTSVSSLSNYQGQPGPPILLNGPRSSSAAGSSAGYSPSLSTSSFVSELVSPHQPSSAKIHFAPLPQVPPDLKRRSSITLGVAARKHLLSNQSQQAKPGTVYMTDDQWELYKKQYEANNWWVHL